MGVFHIHFAVLRLLSLTIKRMNTDKVFQDNLTQGDDFFDLILLRKFRTFKCI